MRCQFYLSFGLSAVLATAGFPGVANGQIEAEPLGMDGGNFGTESPDGFDDPTAPSGTNDPSLADLIDESPGGLTDDTGGVNTDADSGTGDLDLESLLAPRPGVSPSRLGGPSDESESTTDNRSDEGAGGREYSEDDADGGLIDGDADDVDADDVDSSNPFRLSQVVGQTLTYFPAVRAAYQNRTIADGNRIAALGNFDTKLKADSINQPVSFYENYRQSLGVEQPRYGGGQYFAGYRIGRGTFEPWYQERVTNESGEFKAGFIVPLIRDRAIDPRRAELWIATFDQQIVEPEIRRELIDIVRDAATSYWVWVAAGRRLEIFRRAVELARDRNRGIRRQVEEGAVDPPVLIDNERTIATRLAELAKRQQKFVESAVKLSFYAVDTSGRPYLAPADAVPSIGQVDPVVGTAAVPPVEAVIPLATTSRPELLTLALQRRQLNVEYRLACNESLPQVDVGLQGKQDVGPRSSSKNDKQPFELEAAMFFEAPVQRRKGIGKMRAVRGKIAQLDAKRELTLRKINVEVSRALAALEGTVLQLEQFERTVELAERLAAIERRKFEVGQSDLLSVFLREQFAIEANDKYILALLDYRIALIELNAALGGINEPTVDALALTP